MPIDSADRPYALYSDSHLESARRAHKFMGYVYGGMSLTFSIVTLKMAELTYQMHEQGMPISAIGATAQADILVGCFTSLMTFQAYLDFSKANRISGEKWLRRLVTSGQISFADSIKTEAESAQGTARPNFLAKALSAPRRIIRQNYE